LKNLFFDDFDPKKPGKSSLSVFVRHRNRLGVVELVGREPLIFAKVENGVTKFSPKQQKTPKFWIRNSSFHHFNGKFSYFWPRKNQLYLGGGDKFTTG